MTLCSKTSPARRVRSCLLALLLAFSPALVAREASAFDYLEHSYFTDAGCHRAQRMLATYLEANPQDDEAAARYIALGIFCPARWQPTYCQDDEKLATGTIHDLSEPPLQSRDVSLTLGDYAALPDHFARFGPVRGLPLAGNGGLWDWTAKWMTRARPGGVGGTVEDVSEDACETDDLPDWPRIQSDIDAYLERVTKAHQPVAVPEALLSPMARAPIPRGPKDPAGVYSFNNPHYLDLVLRNHNHFGVQAYSSWLGFHSAAVQLAGRRCQDTLALDDWRLHRMAKRVRGFERIDFDALSEEERAHQGCALLGEVVLQRVAAWRKSADPALLAPVKAQLDMLLGPVTLAPPAPVSDSSLDAPASAGPQFVTEDALRAARYRELITSAVMGLVFEGSGLHFLQDGLAAGHMRTIRTRGGLLEARYDHDLDNRHGVVSLLRTRAGSYPMVAFGDSYLLGPSLEEAHACRGFNDRDLSSPEQVATCLIQHQRGVLTASTMASLLDWALGGTLYGVPAAQNEERSGVCDGLEAVEGFICAHLPARAAIVAGEDLPEGLGGEVMHHGSLPVPPPPFSYEALTTRIGFDVAGRAPQVNMSFTLLSELDELANWLTSYRLGLTAGLGDGVQQQWFTDFTYSFHWRWAARFLVDGGMSAYAGFRDFEHDAQFFTGFSPVIGLTLLPEGWIKLPIELSFTYRVPIDLFVARAGFFERPVVDGHWIYVGFGLAFLK